MRKHYLTKKQRNYANNLVNSFLSPQRAQNYQGLLHLSKMRVVECLMNVWFVTNRVLENHLHHHQPFVRVWNCSRGLVFHFRHQCLQECHSLWNFHYYCWEQRLYIFYLVVELGYLVWNLEWKWRYERFHTLIISSILWKHCWFS